MRYEVPIDLGKNELLNAAFQKLTTAPASPVEAQFYYNTADKKAYMHNGTSWIAIGSLTVDEIVTMINNSALKIDLDNLPDGVNTAVTDSHTHSNKATLDAITAAFTSELLTKLNAIEAGAQVNDVTSVAGRTGVVTLTKADVGLGNVTNDAQIKKLASSTGGNVPTWNGTTGDALAAGYSVESTLTGSTTALPRADAVKTYVDSLLSANDAMIFKGTLGTGGTITAIPTTYNSGWTYRVITAGTYAGFVCEIGDLLVAIVDRAGTGNLNTDWTALQTNVDGAVIGPASSTNGNFPIFSGTGGKLIANSSYGPSSFAAAVHTHGTFDRATAALTGATVFSDIVVADGIVTAIATRSLTAADVGASTSGHTHGSFDRATAVLAGANVFSDIVVVDGIVTGISNRALTASDIGASASGHTHAYTAKYVTTIGGATSVLVTHNLGNQRPSVTISETASPYAEVIADVEFTSANSLTVYFATAPAAGAYTISVIG